MTADLESIPQSYTPFVFGSEEEETGSKFLFELLSTATSDVGVSPTLSSSQISVPNSPPVSEQEARTSSSFRRHSVVETSAPVIGQKATPYVPQPIIRVNGGDGGNAATGNADASVDLHTMSNVRMLKRSRSSHSTIATTGSAPARLTVLPDIEQPYQSRKFLAIAPAPPFAPRSPSPTPSASSTSTSTLAPRVRAPAPAFPSPSPSPCSSPSPSPSPSPPPSAPASGKPRRTTGTGTRRRGGGTKTKATAGGRSKRHPCEYCPKTFSRLQDQQRHSSTSCNASPNRATVVCPECGSVLSRLDAAQRHWRGHENPSCAPPEWVSSRY